MVKMTTDSKKRAVKFVAFWERFGNSGVIRFTANDMEHAKKQIEYLTPCCRVSLVQYVGEVVVVGEMN